MIEHIMNKSAKLAALRHSLARHGLPPCRHGAAGDRGAPRCLDLVASRRLAFAAGENGASVLMLRARRNRRHQPGAVAEQFPPLPQGGDGRALPAGRRQGAKKPGRRAAPDGGALADRSADLRRRYDDEAPLPAPAHRHPRNVRVLPPSRDFH